MSTELRVSGLEIVREGKILIKNAQFSLKKGELLAVTGPSGSGKTSLLQVLAGLLPGNFKYPGHHALLSQELDLLPTLSAVKNAACPAVIAGCSPVKALEKAGELLQKMGIPLHSPASKLSRGQRQRVALAGVLLSGASLLLLDEPTTALDEETRNMVLPLLKKSEAMVIAATHDAAVVAMATQRLSIQDGFLC
jgi:putative ABC transport system ATP-binding protein